MPPLWILANLLQIQCKAVNHAYQLTFRAAAPLASFFEGVNSKHADQNIKNFY